MNSHLTKILPWKLFSWTILVAVALVWGCAAGRKATSKRMAENPRVTIYYANGKLVHKERMAFNHKEVKEIYSGSLEDPALHYFKPTIPILEKGFQAAWPGLNLSVERKQPLAVTGEPEDCDHGAGSNEGVVVIFHVTKTKVWDKDIVRLASGDNEEITRFADDFLLPQLTFCHTEPRGKNYTLPIVELVTSTLSEDSGLIMMNMIGKVVGQLIFGNTTKNVPGVSTFPVDAKTGTILAQAIEEELDSALGKLIEDK